MYEVKFSNVAEYDSQHDALMFDYTKKCSNAFSFHFNPISIILSF